MAEMLLQPDIAIIISRQIIIANAFLDKELIMLTL